MHESRLVSPCVRRHFFALASHIWAATWQNQQSDCAPSEDSDQPWHPPSLIKVLTVRLKGSYGPKLSSCGQRKLIRLGRCPGWSESSLDAQSLCWFCHVAAHINSYFVCMISTSFRRTDMSHLMTKPTKWLCAQWRLRSAWAFAQSDQSLRCALSG